MCENVPGITHIFAKASSVLSSIGVPKAWQWVSQRGTTRRTFREAAKKVLKTAEIISKGPWDMNDGAQYLRDMVSNDVQGHGQRFTVAGFLILFATAPACHPLHKLTQSGASDLQHKSW